MNNEEKNYKSLICFVVFPNPYKLHFKMIKGERTPILFESGGGKDASQWDSIATIVHQRLKATVITYDRAGFGQISLDTLDYTILQEIKSLESALQSLVSQMRSYCWSDIRWEAFITEFMPLATVALPNMLIS
ncbi:alpha/beta fold hydrolase [Dyadobacter fermentans]|uniref:alpha/beta fold hydrolase n=1 Tax=Dyadobacter fermentans TaxID=94254 RepID=UPI001CBE7AD1|nr:hypothetical protein [Dyadobacter fermentans]MBZ1362900.1 hypothetical protein [Dyadobacter fermentans]